jgi:hypothetical protein
MKFDLPFFIFDHVTGIGQIDEILALQSLQGGHHFSRAMFVGI